mgnify:CR=1 FL=1
MDWVHHNLTTKRVIIRPAADRKDRRSVTWARVTGATPNVSLKSRERVNRLGARDVHATIRGTVTETGTDTPYTTGLRRITYNPFRSAVFHYSDDGSEWTGSTDVIVTGGYAYAINK